jgi:hypothetical protein
MRNPERGVTDKTKTDAGTGTRKGESHHATTTTSGFRNAFLDFPLHSGFRIPRS